MEQTNSQANIARILPSPIPEGCGSEMGISRYSEIAKICQSGNRIDFWCKFTPEELESVFGPPISRCETFDGVFLEWHLEYDGQVYSPNVTTSPDSTFFSWGPMIPLAKMSADLEIPLSDRRWFFFYDQQKLYVPIIRKTLDLQGTLVTRFRPAMKLAFGFEPVEFVRA